MPIVSLQNRVLPIRSVSEEFDHKVLQLELYEVGKLNQIAEEIFNIDSANPRQAIDSTEKYVYRVQQYKSMDDSKQQQAAKSAIQPHAKSGRRQMPEVVFAYGPTQICTDGSVEMRLISVVIQFDRLLASSPQPLRRAGQGSGYLFNRSRQSVC